MGRHEAHRSRPVAVGVGVAALVAAVGGGLVVLVMALTGGGDRDADGTATRTTASPSVATSAPGPTVTGLNEATTPAGATPSPRDSATTSPAAMPMAPTVALRVVGTSWIEVRGPRGTMLVSRIFHRGETRSFSQRVVEVTVGNAGAVRLRANGMPMKLGGPGVVRRVTVVRGGD